MKLAASKRVSRLNSLKHFIQIQGVQGQNEDNHKNKLHETSSVADLIVKTIIRIKLQEPWNLLCKLGLHKPYLKVILR